MGGRGSLVVLHVTEVVTTSVLDPFHDTLDHLQNVEARETATHVRKKFEGLCHSASPKVPTPFTRRTRHTPTRAHDTPTINAARWQKQRSTCQCLTMNNTRPLGGPVGV
jgi:hypothetical protein